MKLLIVNIQIKVNSNSNRSPYCHSPCQDSPVIIDHSEQEPHTALPALPERLPEFNQAPAQQCLVDDTYSIRYLLDGGDTAHTLLIGGTIGVGTQHNIGRYRHL